MLLEWYLLHCIITHYCLHPLYRALDLWFICYLHSHLPSNQHFTLFIFFTGLTFLDSMYNWYHIALVFWFILLTIIYSRSIHVVTTGRISSLFSWLNCYVCTTCVFSMHLLMSIWAVSIFGQCEYALPCLLKLYSQAVLLKDAIAATFSQSALN